ncbi:MAG TPA: hypothetical protein VFH78_13330 [Candidatus Thermoplasmatota archaeon]|nr:hypothetical protein [Candidatus Thermoplasmatota archaeon]
MSAAEAQALVDATRLFLRRHEEALSAGDPERGIAACEGIVEALGDTLPAELSRVRDASARHAAARMVLERRMSELEGLALQLKLAFHQLHERNVDVLRLVALLTAARRQLRALQQALELWGVEHGATASPEPAPAEALRAAREALLAGCADAASAAIVAAARRAGVEAPSLTTDLIDAWRALDETSLAIERKLTGRA